ncbi:hypothetical protein Syun_009932 [Stephania yunnanensis]|uniref:Uncharacterized protein n=1 Tax=Stephania yunnanensis TaxID=152371 RepID=A0AAP0KH51_9MAGN
MSIATRRLCHSSATHADDTPVSRRPCASLSSGAATAARFLFRAIVCPLFRSRGFRLFSPLPPHVRVAGHQHGSAAPCSADPSRLAILRRRRTSPAPPPQLLGPGCCAVGARPGSPHVVARPAPP